MIMSKVFSNKLKKVLDKTVSISHKFFGEVGQILDARQVANEVVDSKKKPREIKDFVQIGS